MHRITNAMFIRHVSAGQKLHGQFAVGIGQLAVPQVGAVIGLQAVAGFFHLERIKMALGILKDIFHRRSLGEQLRVERRKPECFLAINHRSPQSHRNRDDPLLGFHAGKGIVIMRLGNTGNRRIKTVGILRTHQFLDDHRHLLFFCSMANPF